MSEPRLTPAMRANDPAPIAAQGLVTPTELSPPTHRAASLDVLLRILPPVIVFVLLVALWEFSCRYFNIPDYTLPAPSKILQTLPTIDELKADTVQTAVREALPGFLAGSSLGFLVAVLASRFSFFARGVLPYGVVSNSIPIIGMAPIAVVLFGFDWQSKAVIAAVLTFFPMLVNAYRGLSSIDPLSVQLMRSYAAGSWDTFAKMQLPASLPFVFNALKINTTLALIGAIVGEYFGSPFQGLGYYINNKAPELEMDQAWSAVVVACAIGIFAYLAVALLERRLTFWHISYRSGR